MSNLRKKGRVNLRQRSTDQFVASGLHDWLLHSDLPVMRLKFPCGGISDLKKLNHSWPSQST